MYDLRGRVGYIAEILTCKMSVHRGLFRIYMPFYPGGTLHTIQSNLAGPYQGPNAWVPGSFMWYCAEVLATVGLVMQQGDLSQFPNPVSKWPPILHRDLKLENVLLGEPLPHPYSRFLTPTLCDFGISAYNRQEGTHPRGQDGNVGTKWETAPEQHSDQFGQHSSKSDVWAVGCCLARLMSKHRDITAVGDDSDRRYWSRSSRY